MGCPPDVSISFESIPVERRFCRLLCGYNGTETVVETELTDGMVSETTGGGEEGIGGGLEVSSTVVLLSSVVVTSVVVSLSETIKTVINRRIAPK